MSHLNVFCFWILFETLENISGTFASSMKIVCMFSIDVTFVVIELFYLEWIMKYKYHYLRKPILPSWITEITVKIIYQYSNERQEYPISTVLPKFFIKTIISIFPLLEIMGISNTLVLILTIIFNFIGKYIILYYCTI